MTKQMVRQQTWFNAGKGIYEGSVRIPTAHGMLSRFIIEKACGGYMVSVLFDGDYRCAGSAEGLRAAKDMADDIYADMFA